MIIEYCLLLKLSYGFDKAKQILYKTCGKRNAIARLCITILLERSPIKNDNFKALIDLAQKLKECKTTLKYLN